MTFLLRRQSYFYCYPHTNLVCLVRNEQESVTSLVHHFIPLVEAAAGGVL